MSVGVVMVGGGPVCQWVWRWLGVDQCVSGCGDGWGGQVCQWVW